MCCQGAKRGKGKFRGEGGKKATEQIQDLSIGCLEKGIRKKSEERGVGGVVLWVGG